jgi:hypothetical protein
MNELRELYESLSSQARDMAQDANEDGRNSEYADGMRRVLDEIERLFPKEV